jgi:hypothetical protein
LTSAATGLDHWPCSTCPPAPTARQTTSPERLSTAMRLGARGDGTRVWPSFWPLDVLTSSRSPSGSTSLFDASCAKTPRLEHMSSSQTMSAEATSWNTSC